MFKNEFTEMNINFSTSKYPKELAYFLGFFWADGYISSDNSLVVEIAKNDADDIEHIFMKVCTFHLYERNRLNKQTQKTFHCSDYERTIIPLLKQLGKYPKSIDSHKNIIEYIPEEYIKYFIRGLYDGDGSLYLPHIGSKCTST